MVVAMARPDIGSHYRVERKLRDFFERRLGDEILTFTERELPRVYDRLRKDAPNRVLYSRVARLAVQRGLVEDGALFARLHDEFTGSSVVISELDELATQVLRNLKKQKFVISRNRFSPHLLDFFTKSPITWGWAYSLSYLHTHSRHLLI